MARNSERVGFVPSCAIDGEKFLTGQAFLETPYTALDTPILIHQGGVMDRPVHPQRAGAGGGEGGESVREVVGMKKERWLGLRHDLRACLEVEQEPYSRRKT